MLVMVEGATLVFVAAMAIDQNVSTKGILGV